MNYLCDENMMSETDVYLMWKWVEKLSIQIVDDT